MVSLIRKLIEHFSSRSEGQPSTPWWAELALDPDVLRHLTRIESRETLIFTLHGVARRNKSQISFIVNRTAKLRVVLAVEFDARREAELEQRCTFDSTSISNTSTTEPSLASVRDNISQLERSSCSHSIYLQLRR